MICRAKREEAASAAKLAVKMWTSHTLAEMTEEFETLIANPECAVFLAMEAGEAIGFAQCQLRHDYVEGTESSPVGYLEGIFVEAAYRRHGLSKTLLSACEDWAKKMGCSEFASDCELGNEESLAFHLAIGFEEMNRIICFAKKL